MSKEVREHQVRIEKEGKKYWKVQREYANQVEYCERRKSNIEDLIEKKQSTERLISFLANEVEKAKLMENLSIHKGKDLATIRKLAKRAKEEKNKIIENLNKNEAKLAEITKKLIKNNQELLDGVLF